MKPLDLAPIYTNTVYFSYFYVKNLICSIIHKPFQIFHFNLAQGLTIGAGATQLLSRKATEITGCLATEINFLESVDSFSCSMYVQRVILDCVFDFSLSDDLLLKMNTWETFFNGMKMKGIPKEHLPSLLLGNLMNIMLSEKRVYKSGSYMSFVALHGSMNELIYADVVHVVDNRSKEDKQVRLYDSMYVKMIDSKLYKYGIRNLRSSFIELDVDPTHDPVLVSNGNAKSSTNDVTL